MRYYLFLVFKRVFEKAFKNQIPGNEYLNNYCRCSEGIGKQGSKGRLRLGKSNAVKWQLEARQSQHKIWNFQLRWWFWIPFFVGQLTVWQWAPLAYASPVNLYSFYSSLRTKNHWKTWRSTSSHRKCTLRSANCPRVSLEWCDPFVSRRIFLIQNILILFH